MFLAYKSYNLIDNGQLRDILIYMLSEIQVNQLIEENELLQVQLQDLNAILHEREQELEFFKASAAEARELRSLLDAQLDEIQSMQNSIGDKERRVEGAGEREVELQLELTAAARLQHQYDELLQDHTYIQTQLQDLQLRLEDMNARNLELKKITGKIGELESLLANIIMERDELLTALNFLKSVKV